MNDQQYRNERGQALIQVALSMVALLLCAGLAVDVGHMYSERRHMQNAADAGALAGARELCLGHSVSDAIAVAQDYAGPRNNVLQVTAAVYGNKVIVTTTVPVTSFFAQLIGLTSTNVHAVSKAACGAANEACGLFPLAFDKVSWDAIADGQQFYAWADYDFDIHPDMCDNCDCAGVYSGKAQISPGHRGWLALSPPGSPYTTLCGSSCGASEVSCWILNNWPGQVAVGQCLPGTPGVKKSDLTATSQRIDAIVRIVLWDPNQSPSACPDSNTVGSCPGTRYYVAAFGCVRIEEVDDKFTIPNLPGHSEYDCPKNGKVIRVTKLLNCPLTECGSTSGDPVPSGGVGAVSLVH